MAAGALAPIRERSTRPRSLRAWLETLGRLVPSSGATREIAAVDGLRALAILLVVWSHIYGRTVSRGWPAGPGALQRVALNGASGVELFFVLSGFLLFLPYARALLAGAPLPPTRKFYYRRVLRILPLYFFALTTLLLFQSHELLQKGYAIHLLLTVLLLHDTTHSSIFLVQLLNIALWTLAVEWQFYLVLPWIARLIRMIAGRRDRPGFAWRIGTAIGLLMVWGLSIRLVAGLVYYQTGTFPVDAPHGLGILFAVIYGIKGKYLETFALGMGLSLLYVVAVEHRRWSRGRAVALGVCAFFASVAGLAGCVLWGTLPTGSVNHDPNAWIFGSRGLPWMVLGEWVLGVCYALLVFAVLIGPRALSHLFALAPLRYIGIISYSIYIWHFPIVNALAATMPDRSPIGYVSLAVKVWIAVLLYCSASYFLIERPFLSLRRATHSKVEVELALETVPAPVKA